MTGALPSNTPLCAENECWHAAEFVLLRRTASNGGEQVETNTLSLVNKPKPWCETTDVKSDTYETENA